MRKKAIRQEGLNAVDLIEEAIHLLRCMPSEFLASYYIGSLPFVLGLLFFWTEMSKGAFAYRHAIEAAFFVSLLYIWMKSWQSVFCSKISAFLNGETFLRWSLLRVFRIIMVQTSIQPTSFFVLPVAFLIMLPFGWTFAFYHNVSIYGNGESGESTPVCKKSWKQAGLFPRQNHLFIAIIFLFSLFVFANIASVLYIMPRLLQSFFGIVFIQSGLSLLNTTFLAVVCGLVYLCINPVIKVAYVLRCFYGESLTTGEDLKVALIKFSSKNNGLRKIGAKRTAINALKILDKALAFLVIFVFLLLLPAGNIKASDYKTTKSGISSADLNKSIDEIIGKNEYSWRMPREEIKEEQKKGLIAGLVASFSRTLSDWVKAAGDWIKKVFDWIYENIISKLKPKQDPHKVNTKGADYRILLNVLIAVIACAVAVLVYKIWQKRKNVQPEAVGKAMAGQPDLAKEDISADELPKNRWIELSKKMMEQGKVRLAIRALYLASLVHLAEHDLITIAVFKSNSDYERELSRRLKAVPEIMEPFKENIRLFERIWYGMHEVTNDMVSIFYKNQERIFNFAEK